MTVFRTFSVYAVSLSQVQTRCLGGPKGLETDLLHIQTSGVDLTSEKGKTMSKKVADVLWEMMAKAGVKRCYGIVGDALNPIVDALRRNGAIEFVPVRHEEYGVFAAVAEAYFTGNPVVVCGTAGPGVVHLFNG
jgi:Thiamine pyrophosphate enzyme, N-terminal TPP binding domain